MKKTHSFTLVLSGIDELTDEIAEALYAACNDATCAQQGGIISVDFDRKAASFRDAVVSAMDDVERVLPQSRVVRIEPHDTEPQRRPAKTSKRPSTTPTPAPRRPVTPRSRR